MQSVRSQARRGARRPSPCDPDHMPWWLWWLARPATHGSVVTGHPGALIRLNLRFWSKQKFLVIRSGFISHLVLVEQSRKDMNEQEERRDGGQPGDGEAVFPISLFSLAPCPPPFLRSSCSIRSRPPGDGRKVYTSDDEEPQQKACPGIRRWLTSRTTAPRPPCRQAQRCRRTMRRPLRPARAGRHCSC